MEPSETTPDLVGRTSARLLAAGVGRRERLAALHLLGVLDASTDAGGRVRRPLDDLAAEFDLAPLEVLRSIELLELAGAVGRHEGSVTLLGRTPDGLGGMALVDFLDDVRGSFDGRSLVRLAPRRTTRRVRAGIGLVAAAAAVAVLAVGPAGPPAVDQPLAAGGTTSLVEDSDDLRPATTATDRVTSTTAVREAPTTTAVVVETPPMAPPADSGVVSAGCPTGSPVAEVVDELLRVTNPTSADVVVTEVVVGGQRITMPIDVAAGATEVRELTLASVEDLDAGVAAWDWADERVARSCPA